VHFSGVASGAGRGDNNLRSLDQRLRYRAVSIPPSAPTALAYILPDIKPHGLGCGARPYPRCNVPWWSIGRGIRP
jgi:hypothetical protein